VVEPAGVAGVAAIRDAPARHSGGRVATVLTGSNVTPEQARRWLLA
jgi:threonine dehydratase